MYKCINYYCTNQNRTLFNIEKTMTWHICEQYRICIGEFAEFNVACKKIKE